VKLAPRMETLGEVVCLLVLQTQHELTSPIGLFVSQVLDVDLSGTHQYNTRQLDVELSSGTHQYNTRHCHRHINTIHETAYSVQC